MFFPEQRTIEMLAGYDFHTSAVHQELLFVHFPDDIQFLFREQRTHQHVGNDLHHTRKILVQGIQGQETAVQRG